MYNSEGYINPDDVLVADRQLVRAEVGSCDIFDLLTSEIEIQQAVHQPQPLPPPPPPEPQLMKHREEATACERGKSLGSSQTKRIPSRRSHLQGGSHQKKHSGHETHRIAQKNDAASVINQAIKHIQLLKNQAEWLKLQFIPMAPAFTTTPTLFYPTMLPSSQFQMAADHCHLSFYLSSPEARLLPS
ncbi:hypothetical protein V2J09_015050 [Rumex salicifolius]